MDNRDLFDHTIIITPPEYSINIIDTTQVWNSMQHFRIIYYNLEGPRILYKVIYHLEGSRIV